LKKEKDFTFLPENQEEAKALIEKFIPFFENEEIEKIGQNLKYDLNTLPTMILM
jgi:DNA polymerase I-like protein with 3'-5' exonuclease and polymerase domains